MESNEQISRFDFQPWAGVQYVIDENLPPDHFYCGMDHIYHLGAETDIQLRLFWLNLTMSDRKFLQGLKISPDL